MWPRCLKITEKVSFNNASEASNVYILSGQKLNKNAKNIAGRLSTVLHIFHILLAPQNVELIGL